MAQQAYPPAAYPPATTPASGGFVGSGLPLEMKVRRVRDGVEVVIENTGSAPQLEQTSQGGMWLGRESLYRSLSEEGNPSFSTILKVLSAVGLKLSVSVAISDG
jgi:hypothetical protein